MKVYKKNPIRMAGGLATALLCTLLFSCNNEDFPGSGSTEEACGNIRFGISSGKDAGTRGLAGSEEGHAASRFVLRSDSSADTLCVRAVVSDGIHVSSGFEGGQAVTRGVPVTGDNFYGTFHVLAYWKKGGTLVDGFYMDADATNINAAVGDGTIWSTENTYYWPGSEHTLQFYAWAPASADGLAAPGSPNSTALAYTVPEAAAGQKDIVVAVTEEIAGNNEETVPLTFKHICTAVRFAVGSQMQPGSIKSVALKGVKGTGTYDMAEAAWALNEATTDFSQALDKATTGEETEGTEITTSEGTFMMLPQTLPAGATVEVVFANASNAEKTLTASIGGAEWAMGTTVTYKLSITPEYELKFVSEPAVQDAHYVIYPITIQAEDLPDGKWTLTSNNAGNVTFVENFAADEIKDLVDQGYWLKDYCGTSTLTSSSSGEIPIYVFLKENASEADREITLSLAPANDSSAKPATFTFTQYCPAWDDSGIGVERIQEEDYQWGFKWNSSMKITYTMPSGLTAGIRRLLFDFFSNQSYAKSSGAALLGSWEVTVDFSNISTLTTATSSNDGKTNTWELYNFDGINDASTIMSLLESWGGTADVDLPSNPSEFAARACAMKNPFGVSTSTNSGQTLYVPTLEQADMVWYLPAQEEAPYMKDKLYLSGDYWTSTAITDPGTTAYKYTAGGSTSAEDRASVIHVRAVRQKPE